MPDASLTFEVPENDVSALAHAIASAYGVITHASTDIVGEEALIAEHLKAHSGELLEVEFEDFEDDPFDQLGPALESAGVPYFGYWESHEERSRGERFNGGYLLRLDGESETMRRMVAWVDGEPGPLDGDMRKAGFSDDEIAAIRDAFFDTAPDSPRPR